MVSAEIRHRFSLERRNWLKTIELRDSEQLIAVHLVDRSPSQWAGKRFELNGIYLIILGENPKLQKIPLSDTLLGQVGREKGKT